MDEKFNRRFLSFCNSLDALSEARQRDINHTRAIDVVKMSRVLGCKVEDLLQI